jgi:glycosyltransferase involved in cell wall biosynthesis
VRGSRHGDRPVEGHIFGEGPARRSLERDIRRLGVKNVVFLRGPVARPQDAFAEMDVLFFPSGGEGFGLVVIEAMASGVPVLAMKRGGVTDIIQDDKNGWLFGPEYCFDLYLDVLFVGLLSDPLDFTREVIENGLKTVRERFTWDVVLPQYREVLGLPG